MTLPERKLVKFLYPKTDRERLVAAIFDIEGKFFLCETHGNHKMQDIGPFEDPEQAAIMAHWRWSGDDLVVCDADEESDFA